MTSATQTLTLSNGRKTISFDVAKGGDTATKRWSIVKEEMHIDAARAEMRRLMRKGYTVAA
jgi:hypothetical protein